MTNVRTIDGKSAAEFIAVSDVCVEASERVTPTTDTFKRTPEAPFGRVPVSLRSIVFSIFYPLLGQNMLDLVIGSTKPTKPNQRATLLEPRITEDCMESTNQLYEAYIGFW